MLTPAEVAAYEARAFLPGYEPSSIMSDFAEPEQVEDDVMVALDEFEKGELKVE